MTTSYKPEVQTGSDPQWYDNALRFATEAEAKESALSLMWRWTAVVDCRATPTEDAVNYRNVNGRDIRIELGDEASLSEHTLQVNAVLDNKGKLTP